MRPYCLSNSKPQPESYAMRLFLTIVTFSLAFQPTQADTPPIPKERWSAADAEKTWGIKIKNVSHTTPTVGDKGKYIVILEFTKELKDEELKSLQEAFAKRKNNKDNNARLQFHFFDADGAVFAKCTSDIGYYLEGDLTGRKGDAFRVLIQGSQPDVISTPQDGKIKKVEIRMGALSKP